MRRFDLNNKKTLYNKFLDFFGNLFFTYCLIVALALIVFSSVTIECEVVGASMMPTLNNYSSAENKRDTVFVNSKDVDFNYGDIVVCDTGSDAIIKRIVGLPGDAIDIVLCGNEYKVELNGKILEENYIYINNDVRVPAIDRNGIYSTYQKFQSLKNSKPELFGINDKLIVPENSIFVLGDNRHVSVDSATMGTFTFDEVNGKVELIRFAGESDFAFYWSYVMEGKFIKTFLNMF